MTQTLYEEALKILSSYREEDFTAAIVDTETTGYDKPVRLLELAWLYIPPISVLRDITKNLSLEDLALFCKNYPERLIFRELYDPKRPISSGASNVNGFYDWMVKGKKDFKAGTLEDLPKKSPLFENFYLIFHHAQYDIGVLFPEEEPELFAKREEYKIICTKQLAKVAFACEEVKSFSLVKILTSLCTSEPEALRILQSLEAHTAVGDIKLTLFLLCYILYPRWGKHKWLESTNSLKNLSELCSINKSYEESTKKSAILPTGAYAGKEVYSVPEEYARNLHNNPPAWMTAEIYKSICKRIGVSFSLKKFSLLFSSSPSI